MHFGNAHSPIFLWLPRIGDEYDMLHCHTMIDMAEAERFELSIPCGIPVFETGALDQLCDASVFAILAFNAENDKVCLRLNHPAKRNGRQNKS